MHAPGSVLTYEPHRNSDVNSMQENVPEKNERDIYYVMSLRDWEKKVDPHYKEHYYRPSIDRSTAADGVSEKWVVYGNPCIAAKETSVPPAALRWLRIRPVWLVRGGDGRHAQVRAGFGR